MIKHNKFVSIIWCIFVNNMSLDSLSCNILLYNVFNVVLRFFGFLLGVAYQTHRLWWPALNFRNSRKRYIMTFHGLKLKVKNIDAVTGQVVGPIISRKPRRPGLQMVAEACQSSLNAVEDHVVWCEYTTNDNVPASASPWDMHTCPRSSSLVTVCKYIYS